MLWTGFVSAELPSAAAAVVVAAAGAVAADAGINAEGAADGEAGADAVVCAAALQQYAVQALLFVLQCPYSWS